MPDACETTSGGGNFGFFANLLEEKQGLNAEVSVLIPIDASTLEPQNRFE